MPDPPPLISLYGVGWRGCDQAEVWAGPCMVILTFEAVKSRQMLERVNPPPKNSAVSRNTRPIAYLMNQETNSATTDCCLEMVKI